MNARILTAEISHETNTFNIHPTDIQQFQERYLLDGPSALTTRGDANTELAGILDIARQYDWDVVHAISAAAGPGGRVTDRAFDYLCAPLLQAASDMHWDGILLILHGAMVTASHEDGEGEILSRLRAVVGPQLPIAVTLDPHANVSSAMCKLAQILISFTTYPHVDYRATGRRTAELLQRTITGDINPLTLRAHCPMLEETNGGRTDIGPMIERHALARAAEARRGIYAVSINGAFPCADIAEVGPTVLVTCDPEVDSALTLATEIADDIWDRRNETLNSYLTVTQAADVALSWAGGAGPLVIADYADNPGAGGYGDSTALLAALLNAQIDHACFGPMVDASAALTLIDTELGDSVTLALGGQSAPEFGGGPIEVTGNVRWRGDGLVVCSGPMHRGQQRSFGPTAVLRVAGIDILIVSVPDQMLDLSQFETFGINLQLMNVVALKSMQHFRAAFAPIAGRIIVCDSGALCTVDYASMLYRNVPRPIFPLDN